MVCFVPTVMNICESIEEVHGDSWNWKIWVFSAIVTTHLIHKMILWRWILHEGNFYSEEFQITLQNNSSDVIAVKKWTNLYKCKKSVSENIPHLCKNILNSIWNKLNHRFALFDSMIEHSIFILFYLKEWKAVMEISIKSRGSMKLYKQENLFPFPLFLFVHRDTGIAVQTTSDFVCTY